MHVFIDSHPVTKEAFGFRVTPYSLDDFALLSPTQIWVLYADPETTAARIGQEARGRHIVTAAEAAMHTCPAPIEWSGKNVSAAS